MSDLNTSGKLSQSYVVLIDIDPHNSHIKSPYSIVYLTETFKFIGRFSPHTVPIDAKQLTDELNVKGESIIGFSAINGIIELY